VEIRLASFSAKPGQDFRRAEIRYEQYFFVRGFRAGLLSILDLKTASASPKVIFNNGDRVYALSLLPFTFFQIGRSHFCNCDGIGFQTSPNGLALHSESGKINL
jgi:hypothetical protein